MSWELLMYTAQLQNFHMEYETMWLHFKCATRHIHEISQTLLAPTPAWMLCSFNNCINSTTWHIYLRKTKDWGITLALHFGQKNLITSCFLLELSHITCSLCMLWDVTIKLRLFPFGQIHLLHSFYFSPSHFVFCPLEYLIIDFEFRN